MLIFFKRMRAIILFFAIVIFLSNCDGKYGVAPELNSANYVLTFESTWSSETHPDNFPQNPHFSGLIGTNHKSDVRFWEDGHLASVGIKDVAERGSKDSFIGEINSAIQTGNAAQVLSGGGISISPGSVSLSFHVNSEFPLVTIISMMAPSPDWFVGVSSIEMMVNGEWVESKTIDLYLYDAGTDSGTDYGSPNQITSPPENIYKIEEQPFKINDTVHPIGTFVFIRQD